MTMKDLLLVLAFLGSLSMAHGQEGDVNFNRNEIRTAQKESDYLRKVQTAITPQAVSEYRVMAVHYDVASSDLFDGRDALFLVVFRTQKGAIEASYDWSGEVVESIERFRNIALPNKIIRSGMQYHSGWRVVGTNYYVYYLKDRTTRISYSIYISNGSKKKKILLDGEGSLLN
jgi:hypothetical protein